MSAQPKTASGGASFLSRLGRRNARSTSETAMAADSRPAPSNPVDLVKQRRRQLLEAINDFLLDNDLEVSPDNLLAAHGAFSGHNPRLARKISARTHGGDPVTQDWLDEVTAAAASERDDAALERVIGRLAHNIDALSASTKAVRRATSTYNSQLEQHVTELDEATAADPASESESILQSLAGLAKAMAERTRKVENDMREREEEAKALRANLERARREAEIDHLTGLPNRRAFETVLEQHYREAQSALEPLAVAFCDIDHFKQVNDVHGHDAGDRVIKAIAETLARLSDANCHVARHGGEEFVMLFRGISTSEAKARLDIAREELAARDLIDRKTDEAIGQVTFSGGVANVFGFSDPRAALAAADAALYRAKQDGRNRILLA